jgi:Helix-turn-helix domain
LEHDSTNHFAEQSERPSLSEVRRAVPVHPSGAPSRSRSHYERILALLRERGPLGVLSTELYNSHQLFGRSPRNRISELRKDGHFIRTEPAGPSVVRYVLTHENPSPTPRPVSQRKAEQRPFSDSPDWYERQTGKPRASDDRGKVPIDGLPLFGGVRP